MNPAYETHRTNTTNQGMLQRVGRFSTSLAVLLMLALIAGAAMPQAPATQESSDKSAAGQKKDAPESKQQPAVKAGSDAKPTEASQSKRGPQKTVQEGVVTEFTIDPVSPRAVKSADLLEGEDYTVRFKITDNRTGAPLTGLRPSAWIDLRDPEKLTAGKDCRQKIQAFLQSSFSSRPDIDLNTFYILALNEEANISVIDPIMGYGTSKLLTMVMLRSRGEDWALSSDKRQLFVTMPASNQVAVVDTATWKVTTNIDTGQRPNR